jgi:glutaredoxin 3
MRRAVLVMGIILCLVLPAGGDIYTWIDGNGVKHFSNEPPPDGRNANQEAEIRLSSDHYQKREASRKAAQQEMMEESRSSEETSEGKTNVRERSTKQPGKVVMYTKPTCPYCIRAKAFFSKHGIAYTEYDISADKQARERFKKLNGSGVPLIFVGETRIPGFSEPLLRRLFGINPS